MTGICLMGYVSKAARGILILITEVLIQDTPGEIRAQIEDSYITDGAECASADWVMQGLHAQPDSES
jgi:hypothetical protein